MANTTNPHQTRTPARTGSTTAVVLITLVTAVGGFLFGFDNGSISGSVSYLQDRFALTAGGIGWVTSSIIVGCIIGVITAGRLSDAIGRKKVLLGASIIFVIGALGEALAPSAGLLVCARILVGIGIGTETTIAPLYIAEVAPARLRGRLVSFNQLFNTIGNLAIFSISALIANAHSDQWNTDYGWRIIFATGVVPAVLFLLMLRFIPESPRWLARRQRQDDALRVLTRVHGSPEQARQALVELNGTLDPGQRPKVSDLWKPGLRKALVIGFGVALFQQITGINAVFYYAPEIFKSAGLGTDTAMSSTVLIGVVLVLATIVSMWLVDRVGRRPLLLSGATLMMVFLALIGFLFRATHPNGTALLIALLAYVAVFAASFGTVTYIIIAEIFPTHIRGLAASAATFALWGGNYLVSQFFPVLVANIGPSTTFFIFAAISLAALVFTAALVPETKGRTLEQLEGQLRHAQV
ncbi:sugar porter family MFS transporter [Saccharopolyspora sp. 5N708]|uniref:sugar porter family MFS transporter n=1 Tax=Saccharopolyspora sp. 5N708 TaxID=3457424 RepID=UPI003FD1B183